MLYNQESEWNSRAPSYAYESDSSDDEWTDTIKNTENLNLNHPTEKLNKPKEKRHEEKEVKFEWKTGLPEPIEFGKPLLILIGSITKPISQSLKLEPPLLITLNYKQTPYVYLDIKNRIVYFPNRTLISLNLQTKLCQEIFKKLNPTGKIIIVSSYEISNYISSIHQEISSVKYLCSYNNDDQEEEEKLEKDTRLQNFSIPNLIQGIDAAIFLQAEIIQTKPILFLLPNQSETETELYESHSRSNPTHPPIQGTQAVVEYVSKTMNIQCKSSKEDKLNDDDGFNWNLLNHLKASVGINDDYMRSMYV
ncbi:uncharacterized protein MELLADRAFT_68700 [Melampsora larici-populina 98AG31]|uniref:Uncharacterized protein n=1 Tax=Melampsora larici-populina (strain 98AG31 / pathotype 3-4-7) TaxID=747676 RepID=F4S7V8_MELLP|nr:uncharacterized protein MELLADRAFT_68700 [Melampsora larici-populina 98AG31]EGF99280.1 hypothetical protein MELLADRAFT_68700 [Melampsora larici-populina 98AG31]